MKSIEWWFDKLVFAYLIAAIKGDLMAGFKIMQSFLTALIEADFALEKGRFLK